MILSDFLSRQIEDDSDPHEIIQISFNIREILQELPQHNKRHLYGADNVTSKSTSKHPAIQSTIPVMQKATPKIARIPIRTEKEKDSKTSPSRVDQQPPRGIVIPLGALIPPIAIQSNVRPLPKPPNVDNATTSPNLGPELNEDFEENSPHQEGIITETYVAPDQSYLEQPQELINLVNTSKVVQKYLP